VLAQRVVAAYWQVPPPNAPTKAFAQKLSVPPSLPASPPPPKVQQWEAPGSVQSMFVLQRRTVWVPEHVVPSCVPQAQAGAHEMVIGFVVQLGAVPPVMGILPQQTSDDGQSEGEAHEEPELDPEPEPQELEPDPLDDPAESAEASASSPDPDDLELHAPSATSGGTAATSNQVTRISRRLRACRPVRLPAPPPRPSRPLRRSSPRCRPGRLLPADPLRARGTRACPGPG